MTRFKSVGLKFLKKVFCVTMAATFVLGTTACGKKEETTTSMAETAKQSVNYVFAISDEGSISGIEGNLYSATAYGDRVCFYTEEYITNENAASSGDASSEEDYYVPEQMVCKIYDASIDGGQAEVIAEPEIEAGDYIKDVLINKNGFCGYVVSRYTEEEASNEQICFYKDGGFSDPVIIRDHISIGPDMYLSKVLIDDNDNICLVFDTSVYVLDKDMKQICEYKTEGYIDTCAVDKDGNMVLVISSSDGSEGTKLLTYDSGQNKFANEHSIGLSNIYGYNTLMRGSGDFDLYINISNKLYGYKYSDQSITEIADFVASDIDADALNGVVPISTEAFLVGSSDYNGNSSLDRYIKVDPDTIKDKKILTLMSPYLDSYTKNSVLEFNKTHSDVRINIISYDEEEDPLAKMSADIAAGNLPDIYDLSMGSVGGMSVEQCIAKGMFEDLTPYMESDSEISEDVILPNVLNALKVDGKLYRTASSFTVMSLMARKSEVGEEPGWTFSEMKDYVDSKGEDVRLFETTNKSENLDYFIYGGLGDFVDWSNGTCSFDSPEFKDLLQICNRGTNDETDYSDYEENSVPNLVRNKQLLFIQGGINPEDYKMYKALYEDDICYKGYPNKNKKGSFINTNGGLAISSKTEYKDEAWQFVRTLFTEEYQSKNYVDYYSIPTRKDVYEEYIKLIQNTEENAKDKYGNDMYPINGTFSWYDLEITLEPFNDSETEDFRKLIESADELWVYDTGIAEIIREEALSYFQGDKSVDEVASIIQNRVNTYINENK
ncbi:MAG: extracellular solute-binding protein [Eubacterium sp.]|nr:extracellular solute-binding protein [Eubacterium sp.]